LEVSKFGGAQPDDPEWRLAEPISKRDRMARWRKGTNGTVVSIADFPARKVSG
jgi:hypothetical protein